MTQPIEIQTIAHQHIQLETRVAGPAEGAVVILLHGFPECWHIWQQQLHYLSDKGYRVYAPNLRGYGLSSKPSQLADYELGELVLDIEAIRQHSGVEKIHLVGHDWGGALAWHYAQQFAERTQSLSILNCPHPLAFIQCIKRQPFQLLKSWYMFFFQLPCLPERLLALHDHFFLKTIIQRTSASSYSASMMNHLATHWQQAGALTAMINYYRANFRLIFSKERPLAKGLSNAKIACPAQILWGEKDTFLCKELAEKSLTFTTNATLITYPNATHWLAVDEPDAINQQLLKLFKKHASLSQ